MATSTHYAANRPEAVFDIATEPKAKVDIVIHAVLARRPDVDNAFRLGARFGQRNRFRLTIKTRITGLGITQCMRYHDGSTVTLGDLVNVPVPSGTAKARVVMLGETYEHLDVDLKFVEWVKRDKLLEPTSIVVEWVDGNPLAHDDPRYAPVGNYMFSPLDRWVTRDT